MSKKQKAVQTPKGYKEVKRGNLVSFEVEGDKAEGKLISVETGIGKYETPLYNYEDAKDKEVRSFFGSTVIDSFFKNIKPGNAFFIVYTCKVKSAAGRKVKNFRMFTK